MQFYACHVIAYANVAPQVSITVRLTFTRPYAFTEACAVLFVTLKPQVLSSVLPLSPDDIPELINYVFLTHCRTRAEV